MKQRLIHRIEFKRALMLILVILIAVCTTIGIISEDFWMTAFFTGLEIYVMYNLIIE